MMMFHKFTTTTTSTSFSLSKCSLCNNFISRHHSKFMRCVEELSVCWNCCHTWLEGWLGELFVYYYVVWGWWAVRNTTEIQIYTSRVNELGWLWKLIANFCCENWFSIFSHTSIRFVRSEARKKSGEWSSHRDCVWKIGENLSHNWLPQLRMKKKVH